MFISTAYKVTDCHIEPITLSDHAPVILNIDLGKENFFRYWRLNISLLTDTAIIQDLKQNLKEYFKTNDNREVAPSILWEGAKAVIRGKMIQPTYRLKKIRLEEQTKLQNKTESEHKSTGTHNTLIELKETRKALDKLLTYKAEP